MKLFDLPNRSTRSADSQIAKKVKTAEKTPTKVKGGNDLFGRIELIKQHVEKALGKYKDEYTIINTEEALHDYIDACIKNHYIAIDTETDGLDPLINTIAGICIYTYGQKGAYIPLNHVSYITGEKSKGQLSIDFVIQEFERLLATHPNIDMFNAVFDIRVLRHMGLKDIYCTWDGYVAARLMNENEPTNQLKMLHLKYCLNGIGDAFTFEDLFKGIPFTKIPYTIGYLYAAHDPVITSEYCDFQRKHLYWEKDCTPEDRNGMNGVAWAFFHIEMPTLMVVADMEDNGIKLDMAYNRELSVKYNENLRKKEAECHALFHTYDREIENYKKSNPYHKLDDPINISSPTQLAVFFYDILCLDPPDPKNPRGTGEEILSKMDNDVAKTILEYRAYANLISTYIEKMPDCMNPNDGRVHCKFNSYGADTGRFSSSDPNLQNLPSHVKDIRPMFIADNTEQEVMENNNSFEVDHFSEVETKNGWVFVTKIQVGDELLVTENGSNDFVKVTNIEPKKDSIVLYF